MNASSPSGQALNPAVSAGPDVWTGPPVHRNLPAASLVAQAISRGEGRLSVSGAVIVRTGTHTGRSVADKFIVDEQQTTGDIWWGRLNQRLAPERFNILKERVQAYLQGQELFEQDLYVSSDPARRLRVKLISTGAWQALFARNLFIHPSPEELADFKPDFVILHAPHFQARPEIDGVRSSTAIVLSFAQRMIVITGTE